jgi:hypothetical protein
MPDTKNKGSRKNGKRKSLKKTRPEPVKQKPDSAATESVSSNSSSSTSSASVATEHVQLDVATQSPDANSLAFIGNSLCYFNDLPHSIAQRQAATQQPNLRLGCLLKGGSSLPATLASGGDEYFPDCHASIDALLARGPWPTVVLQDHTQAPARLDSRATSVAVLRDQFVPALLQAGTKTVVMYQTFG